MIIGMHSWLIGQRFKFTPPNVVELKKEKKKSKVWAKYIYFRLKKKVGEYIDQDERL